jgi:hypothetical protein
MGGYSDLTVDRAVSQFSDPVPDYHSGGVFWGEYLLYDGGDWPDRMDRNCTIDPW